MKAIDIHNWRAHRIIDLFHVANTQCILSRDIVPDSGNIPYVTASSLNNGVSTYISIKPQFVEKGNCIFIGGKTMVVSYQKEDFVSNDSHNLTLRLRNQDFRSDNVYLFLVAILKSTLSRIYEWNDSISFKTIQSDTIVLPTLSNNVPDFNFMEHYISVIKERVSNDLLNKLRASKFSNNRMIDFSLWREFPISTLFRIEKGTRLTKADMREGNIPFIGASAMNNGITSYISNDTNIHPGNTITVSYNGSVGQAFYQEKPFWASDDINVLYPRFPLNRYIAMFLIPIIKRKGKSYEFIDKWKKEYMERDTLLIPAHTNGEPNFEYMETFIFNLISKTETHLHNLISV